MGARPATLGDLRASGWESVPVAEEIRRNVAARIAAGRPLVDGLVGFGDTVLPQLENALLAGHDVIFLGERGQGKTRLIRSLVTLLDEWMPVVAGSEVNDDPYQPVSAEGRSIAVAAGDSTPITWVRREERYSEKLATPDTSIADLVGEIDPIRVAEGRYLSDERTLHYGLVPRSNRGIFAVNELPDLAERIQVGLLNLLQERDVQIRGHKVRLPLDLLLVASANPEDYTSRGRIITPLKDRFGAQVRTHYPANAAEELAIVRQEAAPLGLAGLRVEVPAFMAHVVAEISHIARRDPHVNQYSGVSVRVSIANYETLVANAARRALRCGESEVVPRVSDCAALVASTAGKVELDVFDDDDGERVLAGFLEGALASSFHAHLAGVPLDEAVAAFSDGRVVEVGDDVPARAYGVILAEMPELRAPVRALVPTQSAGAVASALELVLEGLHLTGRLAKEVTGAHPAYRRIV